MMVEVPIYDIYSKRKKRAEEAGQPDVYKYDEIPQALRHQVIYIWKTAIGTWQEVSYDRSDEPPESIWIAIEHILCRELGLPPLGVSGQKSFTKCCTFLLEESKIDNILDLIEISFRAIETLCSELDGAAKLRAKITQAPDDAVDELNARFKEHGIGYQYTGGRIVRIDSQYVHTEAVLPAISLLQKAGFEGACEEFLDAHKRYREGNNKDAISNALKAFESTMKSICSLMGWEFPRNATARPLIDICIANGLIPEPLQAHFGALRATLENGLPTTANRLARHGQGRATVAVPHHYAAYALHLAATNIVFLVEAYTAMKK